MRNRMLLMGAVAMLIVAAPAMAFHDDGVAHCNGCHTMHNLQNGVAVATGEDNALLDPAFGNPFLLLGPSASDTCLRCHGRDGASYNVFNPDWATEEGGTLLREYYSAGNFGFLLEDQLYEGHGSTVITGDAAGHNIRSFIFGSEWDQTLSAPPSDGSSPMANNMLECSSCHDPHGTDGFRLLYKKGQSVNVGGDVVTFAPTTEVIAWGISYSQVEAQNNHNIYNSGYSQWCATCHTGLHASSGNLIHPSGEPLGNIVSAQYNKYRGTTDCVATAVSPCGTGTTIGAYLPDVPFEDTDFNETHTTYVNGADPTSRVACVSCHRAHATSAPDAGRWEFQVTLLDEDGGDSGSWPIPNPFDGNQRSLCNKCHGKDVFDHLPEGAGAP